MIMLNTLFPKVADNTYKGSRIAKWLLFIIVIKSFVSGGIHLLASDGGAQSIASIALDKFTQGGADTVVTIFGMWGLEQLVIGVIAVIILCRYQSLIPMAWAIYALEYSLRGLAHFFTPGVMSVNTPPGAAADTLLIPLTIFMFLITLYTSSKRTSNKS